jgi:ferric-dicitrate binding protein FerR (iron transport regulator)
MKITRALLEKYDMGLCSPEEIAAVEAWVETGEGGNELLVLPEGEDRQAHLEQMWKAIAPASRRRRLVWYVSAASLAALAATLFFLMTGPKPENAVTATRWRTVFNDGNTVRELKLPDSSIVVLNYGAVIRYPDNYRDGNRELQLVDGEALFYIAGAPERPFAVRIGHAAVQVLGTSFNIRRNGVSWELTLQSGKVRFASPGITPVVLRPGQQLVFDTASNAVAVLPHVNAGHVIAWKTTELVFEDTPLPAVLEAVSRCYRARIEIGSSRLQQLTFTGDFKGAPLETVLDVLSSATGARFETPGRGVIKVK